MSPQRIQRRRTKGWKAPEGAVYVGRGSKWGNPYPVGSIYPQGDHWVVLNAVNSIHLYRQDLDKSLLGRETLRSRIRRELAGKDLMCWCPLDKPCHGDVLLEIANGEPV